ncbi:MAG TPA: DUF6624 domain-containing protein [Acidobacteriaceae bacterium]|nr:DUF6624 domain-containing protein [Acidobacteriaceae bacterium]
MKMLRVWAPLVLCLGMVSGVVAQETAAAGGDAVWRNDLAARRAELIKRNGAGTNVALRDKLVAMYARDQEARGAGTGQPAYTAKTAAVDAELTTELKGIVARHGWPTIAMVGFDASNDAMAMLTHTRDHAWQLALVPRLERLAAEGKIDGSALATVVDKELVGEGKLQRYGTQFKVVDGKMAMIAVEDPAGLDARRAMVFLMPIKAYEEMLSEQYHLKVSDAVVAAK